MEATTLIRPLAYGDIEKVMEIGRKAHAESDVWNGIKIDERVLRGALGRSINDKNCWAYVHVTRGEIDGVMIGVVHQVWFSLEKMATDMWLHSTRAGAGAALLRGFVKWAKPRAKLVLMGVSHQYGKDEAKLYERVGLKRAGGIYATGGE